LGAKINPAVGCARREDKEKERKREDLLAKNEDKNYMLSY
jgi:hypothetical protein